MSKKLNSLELFAGAGGMALGFAKAGFKHHRVIEWNSHAFATLTSNQKSHFDLSFDGQIYQADVSKFDYSQICLPIHLVGGHPVNHFRLEENIVVSPINEICFLK